MRTTGPIHATTADTQANAAAPRRLTLLSSILSAVADVMDRHANSRTDHPHQTGDSHQPWCAPQQHVDGDDRCVSAATSITPRAACWLLMGDGKPRAVIRIARDAELTMEEACDLATSLFELIDVARTTATR